MWSDQMGWLSSKSSYESSNAWELLAKLVESKSESLLLLEELLGVLGRGLLLVLLLLLLLLSDMVLNW